MRRFAQLYHRLLAGNAGTRRPLLADYFADCAPEERPYALSWLRGRQRRLLKVETLRREAQRGSELPEWLFEETLKQVGDLSETAALLNGRHDAGPSEPLSVWHMRLQAWERLSETDRVQNLRHWWQALSPREALVLNRRLLGRLRLRIPDAVFAGALADALELPAAALAYRLSRADRLTPADAAALLSHDLSDCRDRLPYPQPDLAEAGSGAPSGAATDWHAEAYYGGLRLQMVRRAEVSFWDSQGCPVDVSEQLSALAESLPADCVLDTELVLASDNGLRPGDDARQPNARLLVHDIMEFGQDLREQSLGARLLLRDALLEARPGLLKPNRSSCASWSELEGCELPGLLLRQRASSYCVESHWQLWRGKSIDAVLVYAEPGGEGRYNQLNLAVRDSDGLVPVAKLAADLPAAEQDALDAWIRERTTERFGPVRAVAPERVFRLRYQGVRNSRRHKAGLRLIAPQLGEERPAGTPPTELAMLREQLPN